MAESGICRILVVDDDPDYRSVVQRLLQKLGYEVETSGTPAEAYERIIAGVFDLIVSDIRMEKEDGVQLMRRCKRSRPGLDFVIMTGHTAEYEYKDIIDAGASDFISKPFSTGELEAKLDRLNKDRQTLLLLKEANQKLAWSNAELQETLMGTVRSLASAIGLKDPYTAGHQDRVADISRAIAEKIGLSTEEVRAVHVSGLLHDIGKISVPSEILSKPTKLKPTEMNLIRDHSQTGYEIISGVKFPWPIAEIILQHHERLDGSGYPRGMSGKEILPAAKILGVADVVEAMMSHRPYRAALGLEKALKEISNNRGVLYDPQVVDTCIELFVQDKYTLSG